ncbi:MAG: hypothetical protein KGL35_13485 [Bradyrhizobium sp.]|nr:hypothetical protein [Bradyrhizobium sp.]
MPDTFIRLEWIEDYLSDFDAACERAKAAVRKAQEACQEAMRIIGEMEVQSARANGCAHDEGNEG